MKHFLFAALCGLGVFLGDAFGLLALGRQLDPALWWGVFFGALVGSMLWGRK